MSHHEPTDRRGSTGGREPPGRRQYAPVSPPVALTIAGSDSGGGAGIQADLKTMEAHGAFGTSVVTATTAQNTVGVHDVHVLPIDHIAAQYDAVIDDFAPAAVKTGMLATADVIETVVDCLAAFEGSVVVDPVMVAATGDRLLSEAAETAYDALIERATLLTPNVDEAEILTGSTVDSPEAAAAAGETLVEQGADAALVKGGHIAGDRVVDTLVVADGDKRQTERFSHPRVDTEATHGSGCTLSSAIAARLAAGESLHDAVAAGVAFMERAVRYGIDVGNGPGSVHHLVGLRERAERVDAGAAADQFANRLAVGEFDAIAPVDGFACIAATPYSESAAELVGSGRTSADTADTVDVGGDSTLADGLLALREHDPTLRVAVRCRLDNAVDDAIGSLAWPKPVLLAAGEETGQSPADTRNNGVPFLARSEPEGQSVSVVLAAPDVDTAIERLASLSVVVSS